MLLADVLDKSILSDDALAFIAELHRQFNHRRLELIARRKEIAEQIKSGDLSSLKDEFSESSWKVAHTPHDLIDRRVEITGPAERKMMINALNSGACVFMADLEDSLSPTWSNSVMGQRNLFDAVRHQITFTAANGKEYKLNDSIATLLVRPRGWHMIEKHFTVDGEFVSGSLFDFGLYFFHNAKELLARGSGPYFYLPKLEGFLEARLWRDVFYFSEAKLGIPYGSIRATMLIETLPGALQMEGMLYELREYASGLNAGRWDYLFSMIKKLGHGSLIFPDRSSLTMTVPFMATYCDKIVEVCHRRGAHAMGGMSAFIPSRKDEEVNRIAYQKIKEDKHREVQRGFDGTWVAHPDLVSVARGVFEEYLESEPNQKSRAVLTDTPYDSLIPRSFPESKITEFEHNIRVSLQYIDAWLRGSGAVTLNNLMEDAATAEISRAQLWQWVRNSVTLADGAIASAEHFEEVLSREQKSLGVSQTSAELLRQMVLTDDFVEFLTLPAYQIL